MTKEEAIEFGAMWLQINEDCKDSNTYKFFQMAIETLKQPQKTGYWIEHPHEWGDDWQYSRYECSCCHDWANFDSVFCPNCGVKMVDKSEV